MKEQQSQERAKTATTDKQNSSIDERTQQNVHGYAHKGKGKISQRLKELDNEWDLERTLQVNAAAIGFTGVLLGLFVDKRFLIMPLLASAFLAQHAIQGWTPPVIGLRKMGLRSRTEISRERYALKALKGDFKNVSSADDAWESAG